MLRVLLASQRSFLFEPLHFDSSHQRSTDRDVFRFCELTHFNFSIFYHSRIGWLRSIQESWRRIHESFRVELIFNGFVFRFIDARCAKPIKLRRGLIFSFFFFSFFFFPTEFHITQYHETRPFHFLISNLRISDLGSPITIVANTIFVPADFAAIHMYKHEGDGKGDQI